MHMITSFGQGIARVGTCEYTEKLFYMLLLQIYFQFHTGRYPQKILRALREITKGQKTVKGV